MTGGRRAETGESIGAALTGDVGEVGHDVILPFWMWRAFCPRFLRGSVGLSRAVLVPVAQTREFGRNVARLMAEAGVGSG